MPTFKETDDFVVNLKQPQASEKLNKPVAHSQNSWLDFIQYNNAFLVVLVVCVLAFGSLTFASEEVRDATIGGKTVYAEGTDNTLLLAQDFDKFNMGFKITGILEDDEQYIVSYSYIDFDLISSASTDNNAITSGAAWQFAERQGARTISKPFRQDLGLYLAEQLRQEANARIKELKNLQKEEREKGETKIVQITEYSGLIGKVLDLSSAVFSGYEPVKKVELPTPEVNEQMAQRAGSFGADNLVNVYNEWIDSNPNLAQNLNTNETATTTTETEEKSNEEPASPTGGQATGDEEQTTETNSEQPAGTGDEEPATSNEEPASSAPENNATEQ
jgi:hypothetical protein